MSISATYLFQDPALTFSCCGRSSSEAEIMYACVSPHVHSNDKGNPLLTTVSLDRDCGCGTCCYCFNKEDRVEKGILEPEEITGFVSILCEDCLAPNVDLIKKAVYQYCLFCITLRYINCRNCDESLFVSCSQFSEFETHGEECTCGKINYLKDYPFDLLRL